MDHSCGSAKAIADIIDGRLPDLISILPQPKPLASKPLIAAQYRIASALLQASVGAMNRALGQDVPIGELMFARAGFGVAVLLAFYGARGEISEALVTKYPLRHVSRGLSSVSSSLAYFAALVYLPLVSVTVPGYSSPVIAVLFAATVLRERVRSYRWSAVCIGFVVVLITFWPYVNSTQLLGTADRDWRWVSTGSAISAAISAGPNASPGTNRANFCDRVLFLRGKYARVGILAAILACGAKRCAIANFARGWSS